MRRNELIFCFQDTVKLSYSALLRKATKSAQSSNKVYKENFLSNRKQFNNSADIIVEENTTFAAAKKYIGFGKTVVLNFANPEIPGGGAENGAMAQEESLCRSSNLFACLNAKNIFADYYLYHRNLHNFFYSDRLIYTKGVTVFKNDRTVPQIMDKKEWFRVDVITCAAPYIAQRKYTNRKALKELFKNRIKNIFEAACDNDAEVIVLGAFGCGAFKNPPEIVASAFHEVIKENDYDKVFRKIVFAIKSTVNGDMFDVCPNIMAFELEFYKISSEICKLRFSGGTQIEYAYDNVIMPSGRIHKAGKEFLKYYEWREKNQYFGKQFSILGDSISTLDGYNPRRYKVFYFGDTCRNAGVFERKDTWWGKVIDYFGGELLVNNSWSDSRVTKLPDRDDSFPSGCSAKRTGVLHINTVKPDVILVYLGINDWMNAVPIHSEETPCHLPIYDTCFSEAYEIMIRSLKANYPEAEIWCCTLSSTSISSRPVFGLFNTYGGISIDAYNNVIRSIADKNSCKIIDFNQYHWPYDSLDGMNPTVAGMNTLAAMAIREIAGEDADKFLDCENSNHDLVMYDQTGDYDYCVCQKCGKKITVNTLESIYNARLSVHEHSANETRRLYSDTIHLTFENDGRVVEIQKTEFSAGRDISCHLRFNPYQSYIGRRQATFLYEQGTWYVRDDYSKNGTWLNGVRIEPGKRYKLTADDVIDFSHSEKVIFEKTFP